jgi:hypothetical protein
VNKVQEHPTGAPSKLGRRALLAVGALGVCGAGVAVTPAIAQRLQQAERAAVLAELGQLEGVSLDAAIQAAEITRAAVNVIVFPVARLSAALGSGALGLLVGALDAVHNTLAAVHAPTDTVDQLREVIASWQRGVTSLPITLDAYANADILAAETYLKALKHQLAKGTSA